MADMHQLPRMSGETYNVPISAEGGSRTPTPEGTET
jgi:hypothetical protein